jgi:rSAM/selenodomain-associated transferase 1
MQPELIIFAKQPVPGQVKTRLQPHYTPEESAAIAAFLIRATVELAVGSWPGNVWLYAAPDAGHPLFTDLAREFGVRLRPQVAGDLGAKMHAALAEGIARTGAAAILGCDVPHCPWEVLDQTNEWLARRRCVLGPTEDGGYYLIGMASAEPRLFEDMAWGEASVAAETLVRAEALGLDFERLPRLRDLDTPDDLRVVAQAFEPLRRYIR